ncbi:MAG: histidine phosphatase family protein [Paracoccus sp. (in: a-proteobacteria)]|uniref:histidine phosphatase family protein n=1 Tax=Paracoccus sp. TaxID=267 RepID=UPI0039E54C57
MTGGSDLWLLRHGQTEWNLEGRIQGRLDSPLTPLGRQQARRQAQILARLPAGIQAIASPSGRAQETARIALGARPFRSDPRLQEIDTGAFTGQLMADLRRDHPGILAEGLGWYDRIPGGEDFAALEARARGFLSELRAPAILVTHGITLRMLRCVAMGLAPGELARMPVLQGAVHHLQGGRHRILF